MRLNGLVLCAALIMPASVTQSIATDDSASLCSSEDLQPSRRINMSLDSVATDTLTIRIGAPPLPRENYDVIRKDIRFSGGSGDAAVKLHDVGGKSVLIENLKADNVQNAVSLQRSGDAYIFGLNFHRVRPKTIYASTIRVGMKRKKRTDGTTIVQHVTADGEDRPLQDYKESNTDFLTSGPGNGPVYLRDITASRYSDAIIDNKAQVYISNATLGHSLRILRAHPGAQIIIVNSIIETGPSGRALAWLGGTDSSIRYYNTLWNGEPAPDPEMIESREENLTPREAADQVIPLDHNPLSKLHPVFADSPVDLSLMASERAGEWVSSPADGLIRGPAGLAGDLRITVSRPSKDVRYCLIATFSGDLSPSASIWTFDATQLTLTSSPSE